MFDRAAARYRGGARRSRTGLALLSVSFVTAIAVSALAAGPAEAVSPFDLGDAPASYDGGRPARATLAGPRLGAAVTADRTDATTHVSLGSSNSATQDSGDDGVAKLDPLRVGRLDTLTADLALSQVTQTARVCGWVDFNQSGSFTAAERACADAPKGATKLQLSWVGRPAGVGRSYLRLRIGRDASQVEQPTGSSDTGEVEDYPVAFVAAPVPPPARISLVKTAKPTIMRTVGEVVTFTYTAKNTGAVPLSEVAFNDELLGLSALSCDGTTTLGVEQSTTCTATREVTQDDLDFGSLFNVAAVTAEAPGGSPADTSDDITALDDATVTAKVNRALTLTSQPSAAAVSEGTRVTWTFTATNTGNVTLDGTRISTSLPGMSKLTCRPDAGARLTPGASITCTGEYTVTRSDAERQKLASTVTVRADPPYGDATTAADDVVARVSSTLTVAKPTSPTGGSGSPADPTGPQANGDGLADTGGPSGSALLGLAGLSLAGAVLTGRGRRHRRS